jgi:ElaB/YqjD/DUF883 family membrane-anchored ribosome-binding protein
MSNASTDLLSKANSMATDFKNKVISEESHLEKLAHNAGDKIGTMASNLANSTASSMKSSREFVKHNPVKGVAIAAAAGLVMGSLLTLIMRSRKS